MLSLDDGTFPEVLRRSILPDSIVVVTIKYCEGSNAIFKKNRMCSFSRTGSLRKVYLVDINTVISIVSRLVLPGTL